VPDPNQEFDTSAEDVWVELQDAEDPRLSAYHGLRSRKATRGATGGADRGSVFVAESELAVGRLLESEWAVDSVLATRPRAARLFASPGFQRRDPRPQLLVAERPLLSQVVGYDFHRGCAAAGPRPELSELPASAAPKLLVAAGLSDPANLGALLRSAQALGASGALIDAQGGDPLSPRAIRAAMGATFSLPWASPCDMEATLSRLQAEGVQLLAASLGPSAQPLAGYAPPPKFALLVGNEGQGLAPELLDLADVELTIPMAGGADSLNVGAAAAVFLYALLHSSAGTRVDLERPSS
jgi:tRNA G18 (ribose-2'-O)-methylase SpoU